MSTDIKITREHGRLVMDLNGRRCQPEDVLTIEAGRLLAVLDGVMAATTIATRRHEASEPKRKRIERDAQGLITAIVDEPDR